MMRQIFELIEAELANIPEAGLAEDDSLLFGDLAKSAAAFALQAGLDAEGLGRHGFFSRHPNDDLPEYDGVWAPQRAALNHAMQDETPPSPPAFWPNLDSEWCPGGSAENLISAMVLLVREWQRMERSGDKPEAAVARQSRV
ncbi:hypothetical protein A3709_18840 [Halioglobus sp. HI00S01]|uniref:hypothetical protein n=1 Tax=Halioglobus sp. HI00S01 TaxID=1822214 RepID=UPI0007C2410D|nr:hypothetical protein [Halioglobus sp. HI00S01]KZX57682.1 hypothetical protein A3709_18840 [Halioglobus sp. HI00S01]